MRSLADVSHGSVRQGALDFLFSFSIVDEITGRCPLKLPLWEVPKREMEGCLLFGAGATAVL